MASITQSVQPSCGSELQTTALCDPSKDIRMTVERFDGLFYDPSDGTFKPWVNIANPFIPMNEVPPGSGSYELSLDTTTWLDGNYKTDLYDHTADPNAPVLLEDDHTTYVDGGAQAPTGTQVTRVNHHFGGTDNLRYITNSGDPVEGADVYAFPQALWDASAPTLQAIAKTETAADGRWNEPFFLTPGVYTIVFLKPNQYGPDTRDITVI